jgi:acyl carrier protein
MTANEYDIKIRAHLLEKFPLARKRNVQDRDSLLETGVLDSLGILDLVHHLESEFGLHISDEELVPENFESIHSIAVFVSRKSAAKNPAQT